MIFCIFEKVSSVQTEMNVFPTLAVNSYKRERRRVNKTSSCMLIGFPDQHKWTASSGLPAAGCQQRVASSGLPAAGCQQRVASSLGWFHNFHKVHTWKISAPPFIHLNGHSSMCSKNVIQMLQRRIWKKNAHAALCRLPFQQQSTNETKLLQIYNGGAFLIRTYWIFYEPICHI